MEGVSGSRGSTMFSSLLFFVLGPPADFRVLGVGGGVRPTAGKG